MNHSSSAELAGFLSPRHVCGSFFQPPQKCVPVGRMVEGPLPGPFFNAGLAYKVRKRAVSHAGNPGHPSGGLSGEVQPVEIQGFYGREIFRVADDLLAPAIEKGDHLLCTPMEMKDLPNGSTAVVRMGGRLMLRTVHFVDGTVLLSGNHIEESLRKEKSGDIADAWKVESKLTIAQLQRGSSVEDRTAYLEEHIEKLRGQLNELIKKLGGIEKPKKWPWDGSP